MYFCHSEVTEYLKNLAVNKLATRYIRYAQYDKSLESVYG